MTQVPNQSSLKHLAVTQSKGRHHAEDEDSYRSCWQRDRDRIIHSSAFRRLQYKTQVFIPHEGNDHHRTRLTHSLEVAQVSTAMAQRLELNVPLTEAVALAHDLGHPPFGHAGEQALQEVMVPYGGFHHNTQSLHIVASLEQRYASFDGLNLSWETIDGIAKHNPVDENDTRMMHYVTLYDLPLKASPSLEAQLAATADDIAYNGHDIDDSLRFGFFQLDDLTFIPLLDEIIQEVTRLYGSLPKKRRQHETIRRLIARLISDVCDNTVRNCKKHKLEVQLSPEAKQSIDLLQGFLKKKVYLSKPVLDKMNQGKDLIRDLFSLYMKGDKKLPEHWQERMKKDDEDARALTISDYIAGMTERLARSLMETSIS